MNRVAMHVGTAILAAIACLQALPAAAQGIIPGKPQVEELSVTRLATVGQLSASELALARNLLTRLGFLGQADAERPLDKETVDAIESFVAAPGGNELAPDRSQLFRRLFTAVWAKEGWSSGNAEGQDTIVGPEDVTQAQQALAVLGFDTGPIDGRFGPMTMTAVARFQSASGMKANGLLNRNTLHNITRAQKFAANPPNKTIHMLNWPDYIDPAALDGFERKTNIRVVHETFEESSETKELLLQGSSKYDVMVQSGQQFRQVLEKEKAVEMIDRIKIPNILTVDTASLVYVERLDPDNLHSIPYMWGTVGLGINREKVKAISPDAPLDSMALILDPKYAAALAQCGLRIIDEPADVFPSIVSYLGGDFNTIGITDLEAVDEALQRVKPYVKAVSLDSYIDDLTDGKSCVAFGYSGDILFSREPARQKGTGTIVYSVPKEGGQIWFDLLVIPGAAQNKDEAYQLINHLLDPAVAGASTNYLQYANSVWASAPYIDKKLLADPGLYPPRETLSRLSIQPPIPADVEAEITRIWERFKN
jgi:putrescine transport system substrate-binding protein